MTFAVGWLPARNSGSYFTSHWILTSILCGTSNYHPHFAKKSNERVGRTQLMMAPQLVHHTERATVTAAPLLPGNMVVLFPGPEWQGMVGVGNPATLVWVGLSWLQWNTQGKILMKQRGLPSFISEVPNSKSGIHTDTKAKANHWSTHDDSALWPKRCPEGPTF